jgi:hypothetical protein
MFKEYFNKTDPVTDDYITGTEDGPGERADLKVATDNIVSQAQHRLFGRAVRK